MNMLNNCLLRKSVGRKKSTDTHKNEYTLVMVPMPRFAFTHKNASLSKRTKPSHLQCDDNWLRYTATLQSRNATLVRQEAVIVSADKESPRFRKCPFWSDEIWASFLVEPNRTCSTLQPALLVSWEESTRVQLPTPPI